MTGKALKIGMVVTGVLLVALIGAGLVTAASGHSSKAIPNYVGSSTCLGCHSDKFSAWGATGHAEMLVRVFKPEDLPGKVMEAPPELKAEALKAHYIVAGQRFIALDPASGEMKYLNVQYNPTLNQYVAYRGGSSWSANCAGCHATGWDIKEGRFAEAGIGCESCHGPGREHVLGKGDRSKITVSTKADVCGSCHNGGNMPNGTRWPVGYHPAMEVKETGFKVTAVDPNGPPPAAALHLRQFAPLVASGHLNADDALAGRPYARAECYECHSAEARIAFEKGKTVDIKAMKLDDGVSCVACHDPHSNEQHAQLRMEAKDLCASCHNAEIPDGQKVTAGAAVHHPQKEMLKGVAALGAPDTAGVHSRDDISCVDCHMPEGSHMFKVLLPKDVAGTTRTDSCVACHNDSSSEARQGYLAAWQTTTKARLASLSVALKQAQDIVKAQPDLPSALTDKVAVAQTNISYVEADNSTGAHNFEYAMKVLNVAEKNLLEFLNTVKK